ncbi:MAG: M15 family metallopeptidase [Flavobacteriaceae bacterium]|nr:M15 family metallopeptidase [Flavobacteriaceae bacterium]
MKKISLLAILFFAVSSFLAPANAQQALTQLPEGFVYAKEVIPKLRTDLRYYSSNNFIGKPINGYVQPKCIVTKEAAEALNNVQEELQKLGFGLLIYDAYRPQRAVDQFIAWVNDSTDTAMKDKYYPNIDKKDLITQQYIAEKSGHSRGSSVDLTIVSLTTGHLLDMGSPYDLFDEKSAIDYPNITRNQHAVRLLLKRRMEKHGFKSHPKEWWHFTLAKEPYPNKYFDFLIE